MKIKAILSVIMALGIMTFATSTFAQDTDGIKFGMPYDLSTGEYTSSLVAGHYIAIPMDVTSDTGRITGLGFWLDYADAYDYLQGGIKNSDLLENADVLERMEQLGTTEFSPMEPDAECHFIDACGTFVGSKFYSAGGTLTSVADYNKQGYQHVFTCSWFLANGKNYQYSTTKPELYMLFTVKKSSDDVELNNSTLKFIDEKTGISDTLNGKGETSDIETIPPKINYCAGAFQVKIDGTKVPADTWIRNVYALQDGKTEDKKEELLALEGDGDTGTYIFPVRVQLAEGSSAASATFNITATVTSTKDGSDESTVDLGSVEVPLSGTVNSYETNSLNATVTK